MQVSHVAGGGFGALLGALVSGLLHRYAGVTFSDVDASVIGSAAVTTGIGLGHALGKYGLKGLMGVLWRGSKPSTSPVVTP